MEPINSGNWTGADPLQRMLAQITASQQVTSNQASAGQVRTPVPGQISDTRAVDMIHMRLHIPNGSLKPFEFLNAHQSGDEVHVFVIADGKPVVFTDGIGLFPSDQLITQLRLIGQ